jgi:hypothetical protein
MIAFGSQPKVVGHTEAAAVPTFFLGITDTISPVLL